MNPPNNRGRDIALAAAGLAGFVALMALLELVSPRLAFLAPHPILGSLLVAAAFLGSAGVALALATRLDLPAWLGAIVLLLAATSDVILVLLLTDTIPTPWAEVALNLVLVLGAAAAGGLLARVVGGMSRTLPVCLVIVVVDLWSVLAPRGVTRELVESFERGESRLLSFLLASFPVPGIVEARSGLGVTDLVFIAAFLTLLIRARRPVAVSLLAFVAALLVTIVVSGLLRLPVPALPLIALAFWVVNHRAMRMEPGELRQTLLFVGALILILGGYSLIALGFGD